MLQSGRGAGRAGAMSVASVGWSNGSFNVPVLQRNDDGKRGAVRLVKKRRDGRIWQYWKALS